MPTIWTRRRFLSGLGVPALAVLGPQSGAAGTSPADARNPSAGTGPRSAAGGGALAIATWDFGLKAVEVAGTLLAGGADPLEAAEKGVNAIEDDPRVTSVGLGGLPNEEGIVELDGAIMVGKTLEAGSVASLRRIRNPISVARRILERTHHVMLVGDEARRFALGEGFQEEDLLTDEARRQWREWKRDPRHRTFWKEKPEAAAKGRPDDGALAGVGTPAVSHDTVGLIVRDSRGRLCVGMSTSGLEWKIPGRVGDTPLIGCGLYADDDVGAAAATGVGEAIIRAAGSHSVVEAMRHGRTPQQACEDVVRRILKRDPGRDRRVAFIAVSRSGEIGAASSDPEFSYGLHRGGRSSIVPVRPMRT